MVTASKEFSGKGISSAEASMKTGRGVDDLLSAAHFSVALSSIF
ncbi:MAG: hypothetical protein ACD_77C00283G0001 [uncultured bacterium]|nr:MAG: hypothetical protein ACD_77C00283G0001 [uncultured bacterium]